MLDSLTRQELAPGAVIFREGEAGDCAYVVERGEVEISALRSGAPTVLARLSAGELFGEMALIDGQVRSATARALSETTLVVVGREQVERSVGGAEPLLRLLLKVILDRLRATNSMLDLQRQGSAPTPLPPQHDRGYDDVRERALDVLRAEQRLRQGIARGELEAFYQPVVCSEDGRTGGFEALLRWRQPERGVLSPHEFIGLAESTGLIVEIGEQSMAVACRALAELQVALDAVFADVPPAFMAVNLSARQVAAPGLVERIRGILDSSGMAADRLKLEVTESVLMAEPQQAVVLFNQLRALGITLAIDDFGTGYSSLSYLNRFPIDVLKIDRSFVMHMLSDSASLKIVRTIIRLARELGMAVVAEGVEHLDEVALLRELGCDYLQGFLFAKPLPLPDALHVIRRRFF